MVSAQGRRGPATGKSAPALLLTPSGLILTALVTVPLALLVVSSFTNFGQRSLFTGEFDMVGLDQYAAVFRTPDFVMALLRTLVFAAALVAGSILIGMAVAQMMTKLRPGLRYLVTFALICAWAMPNVASSMVWKWMFQPGYGVVNWMLTQLRVFGDVTDLSWSNDTALSFACIWMLVVWQAVPYIAITLYAATQQIDPSVLEAARVDGAGEIRTYWHVVVPMLAPTIMVVTMLSIIWDFNVFNQVWLVSQGGPDETTATVAVFTYKQAFVNFDIGHGAAISVLTVLILLALTGLYIRNLLKSGEEL